MSNETDEIVGRDEKLISKKQLLAKYGFSYGALYRWKRMGLIPDEWFIKKSTATGQETFFPKEIICERVKLILAKKEDVLLDELAQTIRQDEQENALLVLFTAYGEKTFRADEINRITVITKSGESDVTKAFLSLIKEEKT